MYLEALKKLNKAKNSIEANEIVIMYKGKLNKRQFNDLVAIRDVIGYIHRHPLQQECVDWYLDNRIKIIKYLLKSEVPFLSICDVGCGGGIFLSKIESDFKVGVDISRINLENLKRDSPDSEAILADVEYLPFRDDVFDIVMFNEILEHLNNPKKSLLEVMRISNNKIEISTPNGLLVGHGDPEHEHLFNPKEFAELLVDVGLNIIGGTGNLPHIYSLLFIDPNLLPLYKELGEVYHTYKISVMLNSNIFIMCSKR